MRTEKVTLMNEHFVPTTPNQQVGRDTPEQSRWSRWWLCFAGLLAIPAVTLSWQSLRQFRTVRPDEPLIYVSVGGKYGYIARDGVEALPSVWESAGEFDAAGMAPVQRNGKWGWINRSGALSIPCVWDDVDDFDAAGLAKVFRDSKFGWIDRLIGPVQIHDKHLLKALRHPRTQKLQIEIARHGEPVDAVGDGIS